MIIGAKINEFDNSLGTVEDFNKIFHLNPLKDVQGDVEILEIVGPHYVREISVNGAIRQFDFSYIRNDYNPKKETKKDGRVRSGGVPKHFYTIEKDDITTRFETSKDLSEFLGISTHSICQRFTNSSAYKGNALEFKGYKLNRFKRSLKNGSN